MNRVTDVSLDDARCVHGEPAEPVEPATYFDTPERTGPEEIGRAVRNIGGSALVNDLLAAYPAPTVLLDENRQIVAFNPSCLPYFRGYEPGEVYGLRFGEAIQCLHAGEMSAGCGTSLFCRDCGAAAAIRRAREAGPASLECRISASPEGKTAAFDLRVHASLITVDGQRLIVAVLHDIADEKRRQALEQIFFHDVLNTAGVVSQTACLLRRAKEPARIENLIGTLSRSSSQLLEEIRAQRDLVNAERMELVVTPEPVFTNWIWSAIHDIYTASPIAEGKALVVRPLDADVAVWTDPVHVVRCLGNLVKNALEASSPGDEVMLFSEVADGEVAFHVQNAGVLGDRPRRQIFQRSFSTKASRGRGIGTYSVKLLVEQYLGGTVSFTSDPEHQTVFTIRLPRAPTSQRRR